MLFVPGLLTLLAIANAGGDHVKGGSQIIQEKVAQESIPTPYNFNIKTGAAYGTKIVREESGDADGRVKGSYTVTNPRGTARVVEYHADDSGFHANIKTSEPNIKTHSPANAFIESVPRKGASATLHHAALPGKLHHATNLHHAAVVQEQVPVADVPTGVKTAEPAVPVASKTRFTVKDVQERDPIAKPAEQVPILSVQEPADVIVEEDPNVKSSRKTVSPIYSQTKTAFSRSGATAVKSSQQKTSPSSPGGIKTVEPVRTGSAAVKTVQQRTIPTSLGGVKTVEPFASGAGKNQFTVKDAQERDPIARPVDTRKTIIQPFSQTKTALPQPGGVMIKTTEQRASATATLLTDSRAKQDLTPGNIQFNLMNNRNVGRVGVRAPSSLPSSSRTGPAPSGESTVLGLRSGGQLQGSAISTDGRVVTVGEESAEDFDSARGSFGQRGVASTVPGGSSADTLNRNTGVLEITQINRQSRPGGRGSQQRVKPEPIDTRPLIRTSGIPRRAEIRSQIRTITSGGRTASFGSGQAATSGGSQDSGVAFGSAIAYDGKILNLNDLQLNRLRSGSFTSRGPQSPLSFVIPSSDGITPEMIASVDGLNMQGISGLQDIGRLSQDIGRRSETFTRVAEGTLRTVGSRQQTKPEVVDKQAPSRDKPKVPSSVSDSRSRSSANILNERGTLRSGSLDLQRPSTVRGTALNVQSAGAIRGAPLNVQTAGILRGTALNAQNPGAIRGTQLNIQNAGGVRGLPFIVPSLGGVRQAPFRGTGVQVPGTFLSGSLPQQRPSLTLTGTSQQKPAEESGAMGPDSRAIGSLRPETFGTGRDGIVSREQSTSAGAGGAQSRERFPVSGGNIEFGLGNAALSGVSAIPKPLKPVKPKLSTSRIAGSSVTRGEQRIQSNAEILKIRGGGLRATKPIPKPAAIPKPPAGGRGDGNINFVLGGNLRSTGATASRLPGSVYQINMGSTDGQAITDKRVLEGQDLDAYIQALGLDGLQEILKNEGKVPIPVDSLGQRPKFGDDKIIPPFSIPRGSLSTPRTSQYVRIPVGSGTLPSPPFTRTSGNVVPPKSPSYPQILSGVPITQESPTDGQILSSPELQQITANELTRIRSATPKAGQSILSGNDYRFTSPGLSPIPRTTASQVLPGQEQIIKVTSGIRSPQVPVIPSLRVSSVRGPQVQPAARISTGSRGTPTSTSERQPSSGPADTQITAEQPAYFGAGVSLVQPDAQVRGINTRFASSFFSGRQNTFGIRGLQISPKLGQGLAGGGVPQIQPAVGVRTTDARVTSTTSRIRQPTSSTRGSQIGTGAQRGFLRTGVSQIQPAVGIRTDPRFTTTPTAVSQGTSATRGSQSARGGERGILRSGVSQIQPAVGTRITGGRITPTSSIVRLDTPGTQGFQIPSGVQQVSLGGGVSQIQPEVGTRVTGDRITTTSSIVRQDIPGTQNFQITPGAQRVYLGDGVSQIQPAVGTRATGGRITTSSIVRQDTPGTEGFQIAPGAQQVFLGAGVSQIQPVVGTRATGGRITTTSSIVRPDITGTQGFQITPGAQQVFLGGGVSQIQPAVRTRTTGGRITTSTISRQGTPGIENFQTIPGAQQIFLGAGVSQIQPAVGIRTTGARTTTTSTSARQDTSAVQSFQIAQGGQRGALGAGIFPIQPALRTRTTGTTVMSTFSATRQDTSGTRGSQIASEGQRRFLGGGVSAIQPGVGIRTIGGRITTVSSGTRQDTSGLRAPITAPGGQLGISRTGIPQITPAVGIRTTGSGITSTSGVRQTTPIFQIAPQTQRQPGYLGARVSQVQPGAGVRTGSRITPSSLGVDETKPATDDSQITSEAEEGDLKPLVPPIPSVVGLRTVSRTIPTSSRTATSGVRGSQTRPKEQTRLEMPQVQPVGIRTTGTRFASGVGQTMSGVRIPQVVPGERQRISGQPVTTLRTDSRVTAGYFNIFPGSRGSLIPLQQMPGLPRASRPQIQTDAARITAISGARQNTFRIGEAAVATQGSQIGSERGIGLSGARIPQIQTAGDLRRTDSRVTTTSGGQNTFATRFQTALVGGARTSSRVIPGSAQLQPSVGTRTSSGIIPTSSRVGQVPAGIRGSQIPSSVGLRVPGGRVPQGQSGVSLGRTSSDSGIQTASREVPGLSRDEAPQVQPDAVSDSRVPTSPPGDGGVRTSSGGSQTSQTGSLRISGGNIRQVQPGSGIIRFTSGLTSSVSTLRERTAGSQGSPAADSARIRSPVSGLRQVSSQRSPGSPLSGEQTSGDSSRTRTGGSAASPGVDVKISPENVYFTRGVSGPRGTQNIAAGLGSLQRTSPAKVDAGSLAFQQDFLQQKLTQDQVEPQILQEKIIPFSSKSASKAEISQQAIMQVQEPVGDFKQIETSQEKISGDPVLVRIPTSQLSQSVVDSTPVGQSQLKLDDVVEQRPESRSSNVKVVQVKESVSSPSKVGFTKVTEVVQKPVVISPDSINKFSQEKLSQASDLSGLSTLKTGIDTPIMQEQQKLEQILA